LACPRRGTSSDPFFLAGSPGRASHAIATAASLDSGVAASVSVTVKPPASIAGTYPGGVAVFSPIPNGETATALIAADPTTGTHPTFGGSCGASATDGCCPLTNAAPAMTGNI